jgi:hypothetical protein
MHILSALRPVLFASLALISTVISSPLIHTEKLDERVVQSYLPSRLLETLGQQARPLSEETHMEVLTNGLLVTDIGLLGRP